MLTASERRQDIAILLRAIRDADQDAYAHALAHRGPYAGTLACGSRTGGPDCQYFADLSEAHRENLREYLRRTS